MIDPIRDQQVREMEEVERCVNILTMSRNELYIHMRYLDISLSCLGFEADWNRNGAATDGFMIYYEPDYLIKLFAQKSTGPICTWLCTVCSGTWTGERGGMPGFGILPVIWLWSPLLTGC